MFRKLAPSLLSLVSVLAVVLVVGTATGTPKATGGRWRPAAQRSHEPHGHRSSSPTGAPSTSPSSTAPTSSPPSSSSAPTSSPPSSSSGAPSSSPTSASTSPTATTSSSGSASCVTSSPSGTCGAYDDPDIVNSNGYNTYVANNCWADPTCKQTVAANGPGDWHVTGTEPQGNTAVMTYPDVQQLFNNWCGSGWNGCGNPTDTPLSALAGLRFGYGISMPPASSGTIAQAAYDIWTSDPTHDEIMIWVDNDNRGSGGAKLVASYTTSDGQAWSLYLYGSEVIWSLGAPGTFAQQPAMSDVPVYELMKYLVDHGYQQTGALVGQIDFGWEICSTGGVAQTFTVNSLAITAR